MKWNKILLSIATIVLMAGNAIADDDKVSVPGSNIWNQFVAFSVLLLKRAQINALRPAVHGNPRGQGIKTQVIACRFGRLAGAFKTQGMGPGA